MRSAEIHRVDITADLNDEDHTGYEDAAAACQVIDLVSAGNGTIVHLKPLPGVVEGYQALVERSLAS